MKIVNLNVGEALSREQMKQATGGGDCKVFIRNPDGSAAGWSERDYSVSQAQAMYEGAVPVEMVEGQTGDGYVSGYCCASCPL